MGSAAAWFILFASSAEARGSGHSSGDAVSATGDAHASARESVGAASPLAGKTVLHVGDSMVGGDGGLTKALGANFTHAGARFVRDTKVSESVISFAASTRLRTLLAKHAPDIVIVTLGANDVFVPYPASLAGHVQAIARKLQGRECYWMGPPLWKPDTGIVQVIKDNAAPCTFFDSSAQKLARAGDGIHPTEQGGAAWASSFWDFFVKASPRLRADTAFVDAGHTPPPLP